MPRIGINMRFSWIDNLRGIAAILVLTLHLWLDVRGLVYPKNFIVTFISNIVFGVFDFGKIGVAIFFIVSGYVIPFSLFKKSNIDFLKGRFFRLYPLYWFVIILFIIVVPTPFSMGLILNFTMFQKFFRVDDLIGVFWTLQIEWVFYIISMILYNLKLFEKIKFIKILPYIFMIFSLVMATARYILDRKLPVALFLALTLMFLGFVYRLADSNKMNIIKSKLILVILSLLLPICILSYSKDYGFEETWYRYFFSYAISILTFHLFSFKKYSSQTFQYLGKISYSIYLIHPIILLITKRFFIIQTQNLFLFLFVSVLFTLIVSTLTYKFIEEKVMDRFKV